MNQINFLHTASAHVVEIAKEAGRRIIAVKNSANIRVTTKLDESPVTAADLAASEFIISGLLKLTPNIPTVSEERIIRVPAKNGLYWLIDPLDGTREFINGSTEYTVNIALIENMKPVFGVIVVPETGEVFVGGKTISPFRIDVEGKVYDLKTRIFDQKNPVCLISSSHKSNEEVLCRQLFHNIEIKNVGSSLKYTQIASAQCDFSFRRTPTSIWDTAAAHSILIAAGGDMYGPNGEVLSYDPSQLINPPFVAIGQLSYDWSKLISLLS
jgi:3'(2'), 5'-bisphosphate nucleotidase